MEFVKWIAIEIFFSFKNYRFYTRYIQTRVDTENKFKYAHI
jgi:hypothetical protein